LLATSDALSLHLPLTDETHHLFDAEAFAAMTPGALLVNTSRGAVVRTPDLVAALDSGAVAGAALDVLEVEPPRADEPLLAHPNAIVTAHCAWYTEEALDRLKRLAAEEVARALRGERPKHVVNPEALAP
jgi:D-3-phosphoglycerate dehydrogenase